MIHEIHTGDSALDLQFEEALKQVPEEIEVWIAPDENDRHRRDMIELRLRVMFEARRFIVPEICEYGTVTSKVVSDALRCFCLDLQMQAWEWMSREAVEKGKHLPRLPHKILGPDPDDAKVGDPTIILSYLALFHSLLFGEKGPLREDKKALAILKMAYEQIFQALDCSRFGPMQYPVPSIFRAHNAYEEQLRKKRSKP